jgi:hypothetical protein
MEDIMTHPGEDLLAGYASGTAGPVLAWSVEAHLAGCADCRSTLSAQVSGERLVRNRSVLLTRVAIGDGGPVRRLLRWCGVPDHVLAMLAATPSLRASWLGSVAAVVAVVAGEAAALGYGWIPDTRYPAWHANPEVLVPFLLAAPLLVLAGVAAAFLPMFDPAWQLAVAAPFSGYALLLVRSVSALVAALVPVIGVAFGLPGPGWLPFALLLPSLALSAFALAAATFADPRAAAIVAAALWAVPALLLAWDRAPLLLVAPGAEAGCAVLLCVCVTLLLVRRDRFEMGWVR